MKAELSQFLKKFDIFEVPLPTFTLKGQRQINTSCGAIASVVILMLTLAYGLLKLQDLVERKNP